MSGRDLLKRKGSPAIVKRSIDALLMAAEITSRRNTITAMREIAKDEGRELTKGEADAIADIKSRVADLRVELEEANKAVNAEDALFLKAFSGSSRAKWVQLTADYQKRGYPQLPAYIVAGMAICSETGTLEFDVDKQADCDELSGRDGEVLDAIAMEVFRISGLSKESAEEAEKKSAASPN